MFFNQTTHLTHAARSIALLLSVAVTVSFVRPAKADLADDIKAADTLVTRDSRAAYETATALLARARKVGSTEEQIDAMLLLSSALESLGEMDSALALAEEALSDAQGNEDIGRVVDAHRRAANIYIELTDYDQAAEQLDRAVTLVDTIDDLPRRAKTYHQLARIRRHQIRYDEALSLYAYALETFRTAGDEQGEIDVLSNRAVLLAAMGQYEAALESQTTALEYWSQVGDAAGVAGAMYNISQIHRGLGDFEKFLTFARDALAIDEEVGDQTDVPFSYMNVGEAYFLTGDIREGRRYVEQAIGKFQDISADRDVGRAQAVLADIEITAGNLDTARTILSEAAATARDRNAHSLSVTVMELRVRLELASGNVAEATRKAREGITKAREIGERYQEDKLFTGLILALEESGDYAAANIALKEQRELRGQLANDARSQAIAWTQQQAEFMRRAERIKALEAGGALQQLRIEQAQRTRLVLALGFIALVVISALFYRRFEERRHNRRLTQEVQDRTQALRIALRARNDFLANVSHEIRTPMNALIGFTRLALNAAPGRDQRRFLEQSDRAAHGLLHLLNDVLDLSKLEAGMMRRSDGVTYLAALLEDVADLSGARTIETKVTLGIELDPELPDAVRIDGGHLKQILVNLVSNALKFTSEGSVTLRCHIDPKTGTHLRLRFEVRDTGPGIMPEDQARIFAPFEQVDTSSTRRHGGTGLGLAISRQLVELLGGELTVDSELGAGSCFAFSIDATRVQASELETANSKNEKALSDDKPLSGLRLLLVDDSSINGEVVSALVDMLGGEIRSVTSGAACLEVLSEEPFDLVFMDLHMPRMDGFETTRRIRSQGHLKQLPIVAMTASVLEEDVAAAYAAGMNDMLPKPFEEIKLVQTILKNINLDGEWNRLPQAERRLA